MYMETSCILHFFCQGIDVRMREIKSTRTKLTRAHVFVHICSLPSYELLYKRDRLKLKSLFLIQKNLNPAPEYSEKNI